jgi:hypothetical protein
MKHRPFVLLILVAASLVASPSRAAEPAASGEPFVEVVSFKTKAKVPAATFTQAMARLEALPKEPGLLARHYFINDKGEVLFITVWRSEADRDREDAQEPVGEKAAAAEALFALVNEKSFSEKTYRAPLANPAASAK